MLSSLVAITALSASALAVSTTKTSLQCQTYMGNESAYAVPTHTVTKVSDAQPVTIAFTTAETVTLTPEFLMTFNITQTSIATATETVTEPLTGSIFSTTLTRYEYHAQSTNLTKTITTKSKTTATYTVKLKIPAPSGFKAINGTDPTTSRTSSVKPTDFKSQTTNDASASETGSGTSTGSTPSESNTESGPIMVYMFENGKLVLKPMADIASLVTDIDLSTPTPVSTSTSSTIPPESDSALTGFWDTEVPMTETATDSFTEVTLTADPTNKIQIHQKRDDAPAATTTSTKMTDIKGLRGVQTQDPLSGRIAFPTQVSCTKLVVQETTIYAPNTSSVPTFWAETPVTNMATTVSTFTITSTVPDRKPFKTASFVTTSTITTTTTNIFTSTQVDVTNFTVTTTSTAFGACATDNFLGPRSTQNWHIINVYNRGVNQYTHYDIGYSKSAEDCCIECHTTSSENACLASVFTEGKCLLLTDSNNQCKNQNSGAGFFVARTWQEADDWNRRHRNNHLPEYVLSNGPCGYLYDAGLGL